MSKHTCSEAAIYPPKWHNTKCLQLQEDAVAATSCCAQNNLPWATDQQHWKSYLQETRNISHRRPLSHIQISRDLYQDLKTFVPSNKNLLISGQLLPEPAAGSLGISTKKQHLALQEGGELER